MKKIFFVLSLAVLAGTTNSASAQLYMTRTGKVKFDATTKTSPEKIEGINNEVASIVDAKTGMVQFQVPVNSFKFEKQLMKEHFDENYMESNKYSKSDFKGTIQNPGEIDFSKDGTYKVIVKGKLTIHGVTNEVSVSGTFTIKGSSLILKADFSVALSDYKITVPGLVADKIAKLATLSLVSDLTKK